ncbi:AMP-binding protein [Zavarzinia sp. CC-PAN008]|uniref:AMP-binding protein n=1 Tax=Zavarzinia sp. CC-PAN008 TaxID=3243332 RepID=UPI003F74972B
MPADAHPEQSSGAAPTASALPTQGGAGAMPMGILPGYHARRDPRAAMLTHEDIVLTREAFEAQANRRARQLQALGVKQGDFVTIALPNGPEFYLTTFAIWKLGAVPNVVSSKLPDVELRAIVDLVRPRLVVGPDPSRLPGQAVLPAGSMPAGDLSAEALEPVVPPHWKAMTSGGSTGRPKVIVDHMPGVWDPAGGLLMQQADATVLNPGPLYHNAPFSGMHLSLCAGCHVIDMPKFDAAKALELIARHKVSWVNFVPTMMHRIWRLPVEERTRHDLSALRTVFHMAAPCPPWLKEAWIEWLGPERIFELYGGTEAQGATVITGTEWLQRRGSVGRIQGTSRMRILDENGNPCAPGVVGEVYFLPEAGRNATYHYLGAEARAQGDWESIGDLGYMDADGYLFLVERRTDLVLSGGANIYPAEVEAALDAHPDVNSSIVIGLPDEDLGQRVHAIVQLREAARSRTTDDDLRAFLAGQLARYKIPRSFEFVDDFLRDDAGKARRSALRDERIAAMKSP